MTTKFTSPQPKNMDLKRIPASLGANIRPSVSPCLSPDVPTIEVPSTAGYNTTTDPVKLMAPKGFRAFVRNLQATALVVVGTASGDPGAMVMPGTAAFVGSDGAEGIQLIGGGASVVPSAAAWAPTRADMAALVAPNRQFAVWCEEVHAMYVFVPASGSTANPWTIIAGTAGTPGKYHLKSTNITLPVSGGDDSPNANSLASACSTSAIEMLLQGGAYRFDSTLALNHTDLPLTISGQGSGQQLHGAPAGPGTVILWHGANPDPIISVTNGQTKVILKNFAVDNSAAGGSLASHGIYAEDSDNIEVDNIVGFPDVGLGFTTAAIEFGRTGGAHPVSKGIIRDCLFRNCVVGTLITSVVVCTITHVVHVDCTKCCVLGNATTTAYAVTIDGGTTFEARNGQDGLCPVRVEGLNAYGSQYDAWNANHYGLLIESTAALVDSVNLFGGRFTGNTVANAAKINFPTTIAFHGVQFGGCTSAQVLNSNNTALTFDACDGMDTNIPLVSNVNRGYVTILPNCTVAGQGIVAPKVGSPTGGIYAKGMVDSNVADLSSFAVSGANRDGITYVEGDIVVLNLQTNAPDNGPYLVGVVSGGNAPLTRIPEWKTGAVIPSGAEIKLSNAGTDYGGLTLQATATGTIGTNSPALLFKEIMCKVNANATYARTKGFASGTAIAHPGAGDYKLTTPTAGVDLTKMAFAFQPLGSAVTVNVVTLTINPTDIRYLISVGVAATNEDHTLLCRLIP